MQTNMTRPVPDTSAINRLLLNKPQSLGELINRITHDVYVELRTAVELRKFNDGTRLTQEQLDNCLQLLILYEAQQLPHNERTGFNLPSNCKAQAAWSISKPESQSRVSGREEQ